MDELMAEIQVPRDESSLIMVIGVGGAGCNAVSNMWHAGVKGVPIWPAIQTGNL